MMLYGPLLVWVLISAFGPYDVVQGPSSKLLYVHVPTVWIAYLAYTLTFIYSLLYLIKKNPKYDSRAVANAKSGVIFTASTLLAGSVWGKFTWGTWWVWGDARPLGPGTTELWSLGPGTIGPWPLGPRTM